MITLYELINYNRKLLEELFDAGVNIRDIRYLPIYEEYLRMIADGSKVTPSISTLSAKYSVSESTLYSIIRKLSRNIK